MKRNLLLYLAEKTELFSELETSTKSIAKELGASQQSISRLLIELEKENKISRFSSPGGMKILIKEEGIEDLKKDYLVLRKVFQPEKKLVGKVVPGFNEGRYYIEMYKSRIKEVAGFMPFLGTLNIKTNAQKIKSFLMDMDPRTIEGFSDKSRSFGSVKLYKVKIDGFTGAILKPERSRHEEDIVELISEKNLSNKKSVEITKVV